jgi:prepilin peptidase CpaA
VVVAALLFALVLVATITDVWRRKINNWLTYPGILTALALNAVGSLWERQSESALLWKPRIGWVGFTESGEGLLLCGGCMVLCYACFHIGGGDVKLMAMMGAFLGVERGIEALLWTIVLTAAVGLVVLVWRVGTFQLLARVFRQVVWSLKIGGWSPLTPDERRQLQVPLYMAPSALAALVVVFGSHRWGWF